MRQITIGKEPVIITPQNAFGALPIQRTDKEHAVHMLQKAYKGGMRFFDTARAYSDSEEKLGEAFGDIREKIFLATKTMAKTPEAFWKDLETSLHNLKTDYIDIYQFHCADTCYRPGDGSGMYECMLKAKEAGKINHIGITCHKLGIAKSGLYETLQYPFSYLASEEEKALAKACQEKNMVLIGMKGLAGGLIHNSNAAYAFVSQFENVLPIWGIQKENELDEWLSFMEKEPVMTPEIVSYIEKENRELSGEFCRGCGYCMPCPAGILIPTAARMSLMLRRAPSRGWLTEQMQEEMKKIEGCLNCGKCMTKCPYSLKTPELLKRNYEDYKKVLSGEVSVSYEK